MHEFSLVTFYKGQRERDNENQGPVSCELGP